MLSRMHLIRVEGTVQGVGFRPTVWSVATALQIKGSVRNDGAGVLIEIFAASPDEFLNRLRQVLPPLARVERITVSAAEGVAPDAFTILKSSGGEISTAIAPDTATCAACAAETLDPSSRRYRYPFTNCTHCGPRLSIVTTLPYDRPNTTMSGFPLCPDCQAEYANPADRRYHAQPIACPVCGPALRFELADGTSVAGDPVNMAAAWITAGKIIAIKGLGGFQLACDAANTVAIETLRMRKHRSRKPLAVMAPSLAHAREVAGITDTEARILSSGAAPIVLCTSKADTGRLSPAVAPGHSTLGIMLPATPLHLLLMQDLGRVIVLTSGNISDDPQITADAEALAGLRGIADGFLTHNRPIAQRVDDSVVRLWQRGPIFLRRGRGYAPQPIALHEGFRHAPPVMAMGGDLKGAIALGRNGRVTLSQHLGDLSSARSREAYDETLQLLSSVLGMVPAAIATDLHPEFHSTREGRRLANQSTLIVEEVQHHHAHIASCMAENGLPPDTPPVLGIALDGMGLGPDGTVWGGEFLHCTFKNFKRLGSFAPVPLPGGDAASRQPWRNAYAHVRTWLGWDVAAREFGVLEIVRRLSEKPLRTMDQLIDAGVNAPACSSAGRLLDACAALLGICFDDQDHEGEAPSLLEALAARGGQSAAPYDVSFSDNRINWTGLFGGIFGDLRASHPPQDIARRIHETIAEASAQLAFQLAGQHGLSTVALSGGCFNNVLLASALTRKLEVGGLQVLTQHQAPSGDGGLALGQCAVAMARMLSSNQA